MDTPLIKKALRSAFDVFKKNWLEAASVTLVMLAIILVTVVGAFLAAYFLPADFSRKYLHVAEGVTTLLIYHIIPIVLSFMLLSVCSGFSVLCKGRKTVMADYLPSPKIFLRYFLFITGWIIVYNIAVFSVPAALLFLRQVNTPETLRMTITAVSGAPMLIAAIIAFTAVSVFFLKYFYAIFAFLEELHIKEAVRKSAMLTEGKRLEIFVFYVILFLLNMIGFSTVLGLLATVPFSVMVQANLYFELEKRSITKI